MAVTPKVAELYARYSGTGTGNQMAKEFIKNAVKVGKTSSPAFKKTVASLAKQSGKAKVGALGMATVLGAGYAGAKAISSTGNKLNKEVKRYGQQTSDQQDSILKGLRQKRYNAQAAKDPALKKRMESVDWDKWR